MNRSPSKQYNKEIISEFSDLKEKNNKIHHKKDNNAKDSPNKKVKVYLASLKAEDLLIIKANIGQYCVDALVDSGASNNLIRVSIINELGLKMKESKIIIKGLGNGTTKTLGEIDLELMVYGIKFALSKFVVVEDAAICSQIIMSAGCLNQNNVTINMSKRKISIKMIDKSKVDLYIGVGGKLLNIVQENVPIYASKRIKIKDTNCSCASCHRH